MGRGSARRRGRKKRTDAGRPPPESAGETKRQTGEKHPRMTRPRLSWQKKSSRRGAGCLPRGRGAKQQPPQPPRKRRPLTQPERTSGHFSQHGYCIKPVKKGCCIFFLFFSRKPPNLGQSAPAWCRPQCSCRPWHRWPCISGSGNWPWQRWLCSRCLSAIR